MGGIQDFTFSNLQTTLGLALVSLSSELWNFVRNRSEDRKLTSLRMTCTSKKGVDEVVRTQDDDKVVYQGEFMAKPRRKVSEIAVPEIQRYKSDATTAHRGTFESGSNDDVLTHEEKLLDTAYKKAQHLMSWWREADKDGDRCIDEKELRSKFPSKDMAKDLLAMLDADGDRLITFTEMSWAVCRALSI